MVVFAVVVTHKTVAKTPRAETRGVHFAEDVGFEPTRVVKPARVPGV